MKKLFDEGEIDFVANLYIIDQDPNMSLEDILVILDTAKRSLQNDDQSPVNWN